MKEAESPAAHTSLTELALLFFKLGVTAFGGPVAHIALMKNEVVDRRRWLTQEEFLDLVGATNLIPGPNSTELAIHIGHRRGGWPGLLVAGAAFIVPAAVMVWMIAMAYVRWGRLPEVAGVLLGIQPVIVAILLHALWGLGRTAIKSKQTAAIGVLALVSTILGAHEIAVIFVGGTLLALLRQGGAPRNAALLSAAAGGWSVAGNALAATSAGAAGPASLAQIGLIFAKIGSVLFGSGYVLFAFLRADFVERLGWLSDQQLIDATAVGQMTPGPVFTAATFVGYLVKGNAGALVATLGIFLPAFFFVAISAPLIPRLRRSATAGAFLDGVNVASLALMALVSWQFGRVALSAPLAWIIGAAAFLLLVRFRVNSTWLILGGAVLGYALST